mmetsp:Transcript_34652/g.48270  ORF Transcript_34652/g.48270 Transcript_34652/m.48270 type:complete len:198 (-) Transcript_34652:559-1152(-)
MHGALEKWANKPIFTVPSISMNGMMLAVCPSNAKLVVVPCGGVTTLLDSSHWSRMRDGAPCVVLTKTCLYNTFCSPVKEHLMLETVFGTGFVTSCLDIKLIPTTMSSLYVPFQPCLHMASSALLWGLGLVFLQLTKKSTGLSVEPSSYLMILLLFANPTHPRRKLLLPDSVAPGSDHQSQLQLSHISTVPTINIWFS